MDEAVKAYVVPNKQNEEFVEAEVLLKTVLMLLKTWMQKQALILN